jgi:predicted metalloprotease with PDZ domain
MAIIDSASPSRTETGEIVMRNRIIVMVGLVFGLLLPSQLHAVDLPDQIPPAQVDGAKGPEGVIGISLHIGADRIGEPASLYVGGVHRGGPAHTAGVQHGDELVSVDGVAVSGKSFEQVVKMVRGQAGTDVKLGIKREGENALREISVTRVSGENLMKSPTGP